MALFCQPGLAPQLAPLQKEGLITLWDDIDILEGLERAKTRQERLQSAQVILLFISQTFLNSGYSNSAEMARLLERQSRNEARVFTIPLQAVDLRGTPFSELPTFPRDGRPVTSPGWRGGIDEAYKQVGQDIRHVGIGNLAGADAIHGQIGVTGQHAAWLAHTGSL